MCDGAQAFHVGKCRLQRFAHRHVRYDQFRLLFNGHRGGVLQKSAEQFFLVFEIFCRLPPQLTVGVTQDGRPNCQAAKGRRLLGQDRFNDGVELLRCTIQVAASSLVRLLPAADVK